MKKRKNSRYIVFWSVATLGVFVAVGQETKDTVSTVPQVPVPEPVIPIQVTELDQPSVTASTSTPEQQKKAANKNWRRIAKVDLDGDLNYDGMIDNNDPSDGGKFEDTPPGLQVGIGEMTKMVIRFRSYDVGFHGEMAMTLEAAGINRKEQSGKFGSFDEEIEATGSIRVWRDLEKKELLIDSADVNKQSIQWTANDLDASKNLSGVFPRTVYVEGVSASGEFPGDIRLILTLSPMRLSSQEGEKLPDSAPNSDAKPDAQAYKGDTPPQGRDAGQSASSQDQKTEDDASKDYIFITSFDHILFTVRDKSTPKEFINNNVEKVWVAVPKKQD